MRSVDRNAARFALGVCLLLIAVPFRATPALAAQETATWLGGTGSWSNAARWSPPVVPSNQGPTTYRVLIDDGAAGPSIVLLDMAATIDSLTLDAGSVLNIANGFSLTVLDSGAGTGTISNAGTIALNAAANNADLIVNGPQVTLSGGGTVVLSDNPGNRIFSSAGSGRLVNVDNTIRGAGQLGAGLMALTNEAGGSILADQPGPLTIDTIETAFITSGAVLVIPGSTLNVDETFRQTAGITTVDGTLDAPQVDIQGGILDGGGTVAGDVTNAGLLASGPFPGVHAIAGNYTQAATGALRLKLDGPLPGTGFDQLQVTGGVTLAGALNVVLGFPLATGSTFTIVDNDGTDPVSGTFAGLAEGGTFTAGSVMYQISYSGGTGNDVVLTATVPPIGDTPLTLTGTLAPGATQLLLFEVLPSVRASTSFYIDLSARGGSNRDSAGQRGTCLLDLTLRNPANTVIIDQQPLQATPQHFSVRIPPPGVWAIEIRSSQSCTASKEFELVLTKLPFVGRPPAWLLAAVACLLAGALRLASIRRQKQSGGPVSLA